MFSNIRRTFNWSCTLTTDIYMMQSVKSITGLYMACIQDPFVLLAEIVHMAGLVTNLPIIMKSSKAKHGLTKYHACPCL